MVKKITSKSKKEQTVEEKIEELAAETPKQESAPQVMQVVEVMEEENESPKETVEVTATSVDATEEFPSEKREEQEKQPMQEEKKQEVVSEFFVKKEQPMTSPLGYADISVHKKSSISGVIFWALGVIVIVVVIGIIIVNVSGGSVSMPSIAMKPTPTPTATPAPTATPTPAVDKKAVKIQVLNGSGTAGVASKMKEFLEEKGYTVVGTANAKTYDYDKTEVQTTQEQATILPIIASDLSGTYSVGSTAATLKSALPYDAVVIVGKE